MYETLTATYYAEAAKPEFLDEEFGFFLLKMDGRIRKGYRFCDKKYYVQNETRFSNTSQ